MIERPSARLVLLDPQDRLLLFKVHQEGRGACHTGERSCFYRDFGAQ